jgi:hypothetical protein
MTKRPRGTPAPVSAGAMQTVTALLEGKGDVRHIDPADPNRSLPGADARDVIGEVSLHKLKAEEAQLAAEARRSDAETQRLETLRKEKEAERHTKLSVRAELRFPPIDQPLQPITAAPNQEEMRKAFEAENPRMGQRALHKKWHQDPKNSPIKRDNFRVLTTHGGKHKRSF